MRAIIQRVSSASVTVDNEVISSIKEGLMVLVGLCTDDTQEDIDKIARKILNVRAFPSVASVNDPSNQWKVSVMDRGGEILCVSQFTLYGKLDKNKPDFHRAMPGEKSKEMYASFLERMGKLYDKSKIKDGQFGAMMSVSLCNEGPVTFTLDTRSNDSSSTAPSGTSTPASAPVKKTVNGSEEEPPSMRMAAMRVRGGTSNSENVHIDEEGNTSEHKVSDQPKIGQGSEGGTQVPIKPVGAAGIEGFLKKAHFDQAKWQHRAQNIREGKKPDEGPSNEPAEPEEGGSKQ